MASSAFLKIYPTDKPDKGFKGNSQVKTHKDWIEIQEFSHHFEQPMTEATQSSEIGPSARCNHDAFSLKKFNDNASDDLMKACWIGECLDLEICIYRTLGAEDADISPVSINNRSMMVVVKKAYITALTIEPGAEDIGTESFNITYNYIEYGFAELDFKTGKLNKTRHAISWDWTTNTIKNATPTAWK
jgi:type VI secretion system secreted protein Hcp